MHFDSALDHFDFSDFGDDGSKALDQRDAPAASCRGPRSPAGNPRRFLQHRTLPRRILQQPAAILVGIHGRRVGEFVDEALGEESMLRVLDRAPGAEAHIGVVTGRAYILIGNRIRRAGRLTAGCVEF